MKHLGKIAACVACVLGSAFARANAVHVDVYSGHTTNGGGAPFTGLVGSFDAPDIQFGTNTGFNWHPFGLGDFGADMHSTIFLPSALNYTFSLDSDDGALLFVDGNLVVDNGGPHAPNNVNSQVVVLTAGFHDFHVQFFECCGGPSGVDVNLPQGGIFVDSVPVPAAAVSGLALLGGLGALHSWRRRKA